MWWALCSRHTRALNQAHAGLANPARAMDCSGAVALDALKTLQERAEHICAQQRNEKKKLYALHAPEVECIGKGQGT